MTLEARADLLVIRSEFVSKLVIALAERADFDANCAAHTIACLL